MSDAKARILRELSARLDEIKKEAGPGAAGVVKRLEDAIVCVLLLMDAPPVAPPAVNIPIRVCTVKDVLDATAGILNPRAAIVEVVVQGCPGPLPIQAVQVKKDGGGAVSRLILYDTPKERML